MDLIDIPTPDRIVITQAVQYYVCASTNNVHDIDIDISYSYLTSCIVNVIASANGPMGMPTGPQ